jgi:cytochrome P450 PksS
MSMKKDMITVDPPDHTRLRHLVSKAFTARAVEQLRPRIQQIADELLDKVEQQGQMDLIADFAIPFPIIVISELLGVPSQDRQQFRIWSQVYLGANNDEMKDRIAATEEFLSYIGRLIGEKRKNQGIDLVSSLIQAEENGDALSEAELASTIFLLIVAGHETTVILIGNGTLALLQHPEQMHLLQNDPTLLPSAIEELLRYTSPAGFSTARWANEDIPFGEKVIRKGELVFVAFSGVNTDAQQFHNPEVLDITRQENRHMAFGKGIHACLGAPLARLEGQIAFGTLLRRLPDLRLACSSEQLMWNQNFLSRGLASLPVKF